MVFQEANLLPWRSIMKNILYPIEIKGLQIGNYQSLIHGLIDKCGLKGFENKFPRELSGECSSALRWCAACRSTPR